MQAKRQFQLGGALGGSWEQVRTRILLEGEAFFLLTNFSLFSSSSLIRKRLQAQMSTKRNLFRPQRALHYLLRLP